MDHVPVLALLGQVTTSNLKVGFFQEVNTHRLFEVVAVTNKTVMASDNLGQIESTAIRTAFTEKGVSVSQFPDDCPVQKETTSTRDSAAALSCKVSEVDPKQ